MTKREVRKLAQQYILQGKSQHQTYSAIQQVSDLSYLEIAEIVKAIPTLETRKKHKTLNIVLSCALIVTIIFELLSGFITRSNNVQWNMIIIILIPPFIYMLLLWAVVKFKPNAQRLVGMFSLVILFPLFQDFENGPIVHIKFLLIGILIVLGFYLQKKLTPGYISFREKLTTNNGEETMNNVVVFNDCEQKSDL